MYYFPFSRFYFFVIRMAQFSTLNFIPISLQKILIFCMCFYLLFIFVNYFDIICIHLIVYLVLWSCTFGTSVHFLSIELCCLITMINSNGESHYPEKMALWIFISTRVYQLFIFPWLSGLSLRLCRIFCTLWDILLSKFAEPYHRSFANQSIT